MNFFIATRLAISRLLATKVRSGLTMLGIIIGVMSLISLVSVAQGATSGIESQFKDLGARNLTINSVQTKYPTLTLEDASAIAEIPGVAIVSEQISTSVKLSSKNSSAIAQLIGVDADFIEISEPEIFVGSFLPNQSKSDTKSIVLSTTLANELKLNTDAINQTISVGTTEFKIVGILDDADQFRTRDVAYIPIESHFNYFSNKPYLQSIIVQTLDENVVPTVTSSIVLLLNERHNIAGNKEPDYVIVDASQILDAIGTVQQFLSLLLGGIASISLVVGGIGIMNIMLVSVRERTREIGIRRAIGAQQSQILTQFLVEAVILSLIGGIIGVIIGEIVAYYLAQLGQWNFVLSPSIILASLGFSMFIGVVFGVWPARTASKLKPVEALRFE
jgi:putative ABC transport system permease protein